MPSIKHFPPAIILVSVQSQFNFSPVYCAAVCVCVIFHSFILICAKVCGYTVFLLLVVSVCILYHLNVDLVLANQHSVDNFATKKNRIATNNNKNKKQIKTKKRIKNIIQHKSKYFTKLHMQTVPFFWLFKMKKKICYYLWLVINRIKWL